MSNEPENEEDGTDESTGVVVSEMLDDQLEMLLRLDAQFNGKVFDTGGSDLALRDWVVPAIQQIVRSLMITIQGTKAAFDTADETMAVLAEQDGAGQILSSVQADFQELGQLLVQMFDPRMDVQVVIPAGVSARAMELLANIGSGITISLRIDTGPGPAAAEAPFAEIQVSAFVPSPTELPATPAVAVEPSPAEPAPAVAESVPDASASEDPTPST